MKYYKNLNSFNFINLLIKCLKLIDYINLLNFFKNRFTIYDNLKFPNFYLIHKREVKKIKNNLIFISNSNILNITIINNITNLLLNKFNFYYQILFNFSNINKIIIEKYIWNLIKNLNIFVEKNQKNNNIELTDEQFNFLEEVIIRYVHTNLLKN